MLFPVASADNILDDPHLGEKGFWQEMEHFEREDRIAFPSAPFRINDEYPSPKRRAPLKGEHNKEVYHELLSFPQQEVNRLKMQGIL